MTIKAWPQADMPKEKLLQHGATQLTDAELLAILINTGVKGKTALEISKNLLSEFNSLRQLFNCDYIQIAKFSGIGKNKFVLFQAAIELGKRYMTTHFSQGHLLTSVTETKQFLRNKLRDQKHEVFSAIFLNNQHRVICYEILFHGTLNQAIVYPREVIKKVLLHNASAIIFAHNHPSGETQPSTADKRITQQLKDALMTIEVNVLDHFIIGDSHVFSFKENNLI